MATVNISWTIKVQVFPSGTSGGAWQVQIFAADGVTPLTLAQNIVSGNLATFEGIIAGSYVARVTRMDASLSVALGSAEAAFNVVSNVNLDVPDVVSLAVS